MKILFVTRGLSSGGGERLVSRLVNQLSGDDDASVLVFYPELTYSVHARVYLSPKRPGQSLISKIGANLSQAISIRRMVQAEKPDVVFSTLVIIPFSLFLLGAFRIRNRCIHRIATDPFDVMRSHVAILVKLLAAYETVATSLASLVAQVVFPSNALQEKFAMLRFGNTKTVVIHNFVDPIGIRALSTEGIDEWGDENVIITVGRLSPEKNQRLLIQAFARVRKHMTCKLCIIGTGPLEPELSNLAASLKVSKDVIFLGEKKNPFKYISRSSVFVLPSDVEAMPNSLLEAMTLGIPVVATDSSGSKEVVGSSGSAGILVHRRNIDQMANAILRILSNEHSREFYGEAARRRADDFSYDKTISKYLSLFKTVSKGRECVQMTP